MERTPSLTEQMRAATRNIHHVSDNLVNLKLLVALTDKQLYGRALMLFYYVYVQLESTIEAYKDYEAFTGLNELLGTIARADSIAMDLQFYLGEDWSNKYQPTKAVRDYINLNLGTVLLYSRHLKKLEEKNPILVLPYCFHMYMAMLAGGTMIKKLVKKSFAPPEGKGLNCFVFDVKSTKALRDTMKANIDALDYDEEIKKLIVAESVHCFKMNNQHAIIDHQDGNVPKDFVQLTDSNARRGCCSASMLQRISQQDDMTLT
ncbi:hypothetical protein CCR75_008223 [Bremia lactucae]|uniref:Heme oxygenase n=1 Tax=Bremia lactucae TaxID=4779 RepID=A0A976FNB4_BRELC|nr:hypothetical protein CCR75_008223 [Bremia lactucae]